MADINVGGVKAGLGLDVSDFKRGYKDFVDGMKALGREANDTFREVDGAARNWANGVRETIGNLGLSRFASEWKAYADSVRGSLEETRKDLAAFVSYSKDGLQSVGKELIGAAEGMARPLKEAGQKALDLDKSLRIANTAMKLSDSSLNTLRGNLSKLAVELKAGQNSKQLSDSLYDIASASFEGEGGFKILKTAAIGAKAGQVETSLVGEVLAKSLRGMGEEADQSGRFLDVMFNTVDKGILKFSDLAQGIGKVTSFAKSAGVSFEETNAAIAVLTQRGSTAQASMTGLRQLFIKLGAPAPEARKAFKALGIEYGDTALKAKGLIGVLRDVVAKTGGNKEILKPLLDTEGLDAALKLVESDGGKLFEQRIGESKNSKGAAARAAKEIGKSSSDPFEQIKVNLHEFSTGLGEGVVQQLAPLTNWAKDFTRQIALMPTATKAQAGAVAALGVAATAAAGGFLILAPGIAALPGVFGVVSTALAPVVALFKLVAVTVAGLEVAPVLALGAAVTALAAAWANDWGHIRETTREVLGRVYEGAKEIFAGIRAEVGPMASDLVKAFKETGPPVLAALKSIGQTVFEYLVPAFKTGFSLCSAAFSVLKGAAQIAWQALKVIFETLGGVIRDFGNTWLLLFSGDWKAALDYALTAVKEFVPRVVELLKGMLPQVKSVFANIGNEVKSGLKEALTGVNEASLDVVVPGWERKMRSLAEDTTNAFKRGYDKASQGLQQQISSVQVRDAIGGAIGDAGGTVERPLDYRDPEEALRLVEQAKHRGHVKKVKPVLTRAQMTAAIKKGADVSGDIGGLDAETLAALYRLVQNAVSNNIKLAVTSAYRSNSRTFHGAGKAVDIVGLTGVGAGQEPEAIRRLAEGTGFRSGINEYRADARAVTHGNAPHVHLTTGVENGGVPGTFHLNPHIRKESHDILNDLEHYVQKLLDFKARLADFVSPQTNQFEKERQQVRAHLRKLEKDGANLGISGEALAKAAVLASAKLDEINTKERDATRKQQVELLAIRLDAEGKAGDAAKVRIEDELDTELERLRQLRREYPALAKDIDATVEAVQRVSLKKQRQAPAQAALEKFSGLQGVGQRLQSLGVSSYEDVTSQIKGGGIDSLLEKLPALKGEFQASLDTIKSYFSGGLQGLTSDEQLAKLTQALDVLQKVRDAQAAASAERLRQVDFEASLGRISKDQRLQFYRDDLDAYTTNDAAKREKILAFADQYRQFLQQSLQLQGEFNLSTLQQMEEALIASGELTSSKMAELGAIRQLIVDQEIAEQQNRIQLLDQVAGSFQGFFSGVLTGQQSLSQGLTGLWKSLSSMILGELAKWIAKALVFRLLMGAIGGIFGLGGGAVEGIGAASQVGGAVSQFHKGGLVMGPVKKFHVGGYIGPIKPDEIPALLQRGEYVLSRRQVENLRNSSLSDQNQNGNAAAPLAAVSMPTINFHGDQHYHNEMDAQRVATMIGREIQRTMQGSA